MSCCFLCLVLRGVSIRVIGYWLWSGVVDVLLEKWRVGARFKVADGVKCEVLLCFLLLY